MRVLLLAWGVGAAAPGPSTQATGLASALAAAGHDVRLVTRQATEPLTLDGVEVHAVADAPPIVPASMADPVLDALAFAGRATSVAVRRLEERPVDLVHAEGWMTAPVVTAVRASHGVPVLAVAGGSDATAATATGLAAALATSADLHVARAGSGPRLPAGVTLPTRRPGPPPPRGPLLLATGRSADHRAAARRLRQALEEPPRITRSWRRRPSAVVVLDPDDLDTVLRGCAAGVPVVTVDGPAGDLVAAAGAGVVVAGGAAAVATEVARIRGDRQRATVLGRAASSAAADHAWPRVAASWLDLAGRAVDRAVAPRLHAAQ